MLTSLPPSPNLGIRRGGAKCRIGEARDDAPESAEPRPPVIDNFALGLTHGLMLLAAWRLLGRPDLDREGPAPGRRRRREGARDA